MSLWRKFRFEKIDELPRSPGVYAVFINHRLVYIGQSANVRSRILGGHAFHYARYSSSIETPWGATPCSVTFKVRASRSYGDWLAIEARLVRRLQPRFNSIGTRRKRAA
jgi:excinuclease UvrABC nuclease subunit